MASVNKVILVGNLGRDPEVRYSPDGAAICNMSIATTSSWKDKASGEKREETEWHRVVMYNRLAEIAGEYLKKGRSVYIEGRLKTRKWQDKDTGADRYSTEIVADQMQLERRIAQSGDRGDDRAEIVSPVERADVHEHGAIGVDAAPAPGLVLIGRVKEGPVDAEAHHLDPAGRHPPPMDDARLEIVALGDQPGSMPEVAARQIPRHPVLGRLHRAVPDLADQRHQVDHRHRRDASLPAPRRRVAREEPALLQHHVEPGEVALGESIERAQVGHELEVPDAAHRRVVHRPALAALHMPHALSGSQRRRGFSKPSRAATVIMGAPHQ